MHLHFADFVIRTIVGLMALVAHDANITLHGCQVGRTDREQQQLHSFWVKRCSRILIGTIMAFTARLWQHSPVVPSGPSKPRRALPVHSFHLAKIYKDVACAYDSNFRWAVSDHRCRGHTCNLRPWAISKSNIYRDVQHVLRQGYFLYT